ncbi:MAG: hypothetical protein MUC86_13455, partial [Burkholderiaceae bacterium]|nr:hypothetical protein [Burkholderiaceae bacterium]
MAAACSAASRSRLPLGRSRARGVLCLPGGLLGRALRRSGILQRPDLQLQRPVGLVERRQLQRPQGRRVALQLEKLSLQAETFAGDRRGPCCGLGGCSGLVLQCPDSLLQRAVGLVERRQFQGANCRRVAGKLQKAPLQRRALVGHR